MPHSRAFSWATLNASSAPQYGKGGGGKSAPSYNENGVHHNNQFNPKRSTSQRPSRTRSLPSINETEEAGPAPAVQPVSKTPTSVFVKPAGKKLRKNMPAKQLAIQPPSSSPLLSWLPRMPTPTFNSRNELQRRTSPTSFSFGNTSPTSPPLTPMTPATPVSRDFASQASQANDYKNPAFAVMPGEQVYVLTLRTTEDIAQQMQALRQRWFPTHRLKVPAHVTLFHALPESRLPQVEDLILDLTRHTPQFEISTGRVQRMRQGVLVNLRDGDADVRYLFVTMRDSFFSWLSPQDQSCKAHWTIQNKEEDQERVEDAFWDTNRVGTCLGWATGLTLWNYNDGHWLKEKEFDFMGGYRQRSLSPTEQDIRADIRAQWRRGS